MEMDKPTSKRVRDFQCSMCPSSFCSKKNLTTHIRRHTKEKLFTCNQCAYKTGDRSNLSRHRKELHEKLTPFKCSFPDCKYSSGRRSRLERHSRTHDSNPLIRRPFPCKFEDCNYRASEKQSLRSHIRRMHDEMRMKRFNCALCSASHHNQKSLDEHINAIHLQETIYGCNQCPFTSFYSKELRTHAKTKHGRGGNRQVALEEESGKQSSSLRRKQVTQHGIASFGSELGQSQTRQGVPVPTAGGSNGDAIRVDFLRIMQCCLCDFTARDEQEALNHSADSTFYLVL